MAKYNYEKTNSTQNIPYISFHDDGIYINPKLVKKLGNKVSGLIIGFDKENSKIAFKPASNSKDGFSIVENEDISGRYIQCAKIMSQIKKLNPTTKNQFKVIWKGNIIIADLNEPLE